MGSKNGKPGKTRCRPCDSSRRKEQDAALLAGLPLETAASRFGFSKSALGRHRLAHLAGPIIRATARAAPPPPDLHEVEVFEDKLLAEMLSMHAVAREELEAARKGPDKRLVVVLLGLIRENIAALGKFLPASRESVPEVHVNFDSTLLRLSRPTLPEPEAARPVAGIETTSADALASPRSSSPLRSTSHRPCCRRSS